MRDLPSLGERLDVLFAAVPVMGCAGDARYTNLGAVEALVAMGCAVSVEDLARLRQGGALPGGTTELVNGLATLFGVRPEFFGDDDEARDEAEAVMAQLEVFASLHWLGGLLRSLRGGLPRDPSERRSTTRSVAGAVADVHRLAAHDIARAAG